MISYRTEMLGALVIFSSALLATLTPGINTGLAALAISTTFEILEALSWMVNVPFFQSNLYVFKHRIRFQVLMASSLETNAVSLERIQQYITGLKQEEEESDNEEPDLQLQNGTIQFDGYSVRYNRLYMLLP